MLNAGETRRRWFCELDGGHRSEEWVVIDDLTRLAHRARGGLVRLVR